VNRVVLEQVGEGGGIGQVVDRHDFDVWNSVRGTKEITSDSTESVDRNLGRH
jgi:hypothetical protein